SESVTRKAGRIIGGSSGVKTAFSEVLHEAGVRDKRDTPRAQETPVRCWTIVSPKLGLLVVDRVAGSIGNARALWHATAMMAMLVYAPTRQLHSDEGKR